MFDEIPQETFDEREKKILSFWEKQKIFKKSLEQRESEDPFTFYDGPPFATGLPHYGHLLAGTIKDVVPRYKTMKGFYVDRRFGWDTHGLPIEHEIEKQEGLKGAKAIEEYGIERFNLACKSIVLRFTKEWEEVVTRMGRWVDFGRTWKTMDLHFMESVWWVFKELWDKDLVYQGLKVMPFSAKLGTPLSNFEAGENYKDVDDPSLSVLFKLKEQEDTYLMIWTTTPWTLLSNLAIMAAPHLEYVRVLDNRTGKKVILLKARLFSYFSEEGSYEVEKTFLGSELIGLSYEPLFPYFASLSESGAFLVIEENEISIEEGSGLVHAAPAFGEADFFACQKEKIPLVCPVDMNCRFTSEIPPYEGLFVKDADKAIIKELKEMGALFKQETINHRYPFCWRSDTPLIYRTVSTWFVKVEELKEKMIENNQKINWMPLHLKEGRFGKWLESARDWAISRNRYFGTPIPLWMSDCGKVHVIGSIEELKKYTGVNIEDLHRHEIDPLPFIKDGIEYKRVPEVFDCWFESGSMPYAQNHYPFEGKSSFEKTFPADFIAEGLDQTRGWFYTLNVLSTALFNKPAFKNVIVNGIILAEDGSKMSKRLKNYPDPMEVVRKYGADATRLYMLNSPAVKGSDLRFSEKGVELILRQVLLPLHSAYSFFIMYARIYHFQPKGTYLKSTHVLDRYILSLLHSLIKDVEAAMDAYDLSKAVDPFVGFIDRLTNWYIRRSRRRFWQDEETDDRTFAFETLYHVLLHLSKVIAPFIPFISEAIYQNLRGEKDPLSVHLCDYPEFQEDLIDCDLEEGMGVLQEAVSLGHALRKEKKLKVRQPLKEALISVDEKLLPFFTEQKHLIEEELNVLSVSIETDDSKIVELSAKANFRSLGKKVGNLMPLVKEKIASFSQEEITTIQDGGGVEILIDETTIMLTKDDVDIERVAKESIASISSQSVAIALETTLDEKLLELGLAREIINKINTMRKACNFDVSDRIHVRMSTDEAVKKCIEKHKELIEGEVLALSFTFGETEGQTWDLNGHEAVILLDRV